MASAIFVIIGLSNVWLLFGSNPLVAPRYIEQPGHRDSIQFEFTNKTFLQMKCSWKCLKAVCHMCLRRVSKHVSFCRWRVYLWQKIRTVRRERTFQGNAHLTHAILPILPRIISLPMQQTLKRPRNIYIWYICVCMCITPNRLYTLLFKSNGIFFAVAKYGVYF